MLFNKYTYLCLGLLPILAIAQDDIADIVAKSNAIKKQVLQSTLKNEKPSKEATDFLKKLKQQKLYFDKKTAKRGLSNKDGSLNIDALIGKYINPVIQKQEFVTDHLGYQQLITFVSFSMPIDTIARLIHDTTKTGGRTIIRGIVGENFITTQKYIFKILEKSLGGQLAIDYRNFTKYNIKVVPSFVISKCATLEMCTSYDKVSGNISVEAALEEFSMRGDFKGIAKEHLKKYRGNR